MAANKGPQYQHVRPITKVRGVVSSLVWILATQKVLVEQQNLVMVKQANLVLYLAA